MASPFETVAELYASLGLDTTQYSRGLMNARLDMVRTAQSMIGEIKGIQASLDQLGLRKFLDMTQAAQQATTALRASRLEAETGARMNADHARMEAGFARDRIAIAREEAAEMRRLSVSANPPQASGGMGAGGRMAARLATYAAVYGAGRFVSAAIQRPIDIERQSEQTGLSTAGTQQLQYAAAATGTPIEMTMASIVRLQQRIQDEEPKAMRVLKELKIPAQEFKDMLDQDTSAAITKVIQAIERLDSASKQAAAFQDMFGGRGGRQTEALKQFADGAQRAVVLTEDQIRAVREVGEWWEVTKLKAQAYFDMILAHAIGSPMGRSGAFGGSVAGGILGMQAGTALGPYGVAALGGAGAVGGALLGDVEVQRLQNTFRSSTGMPTPPGSPGMSLSKPLGNQDLSGSREGNANWAALQKSAQQMDRDARQKIVQERREAGEHTRILDEFAPAGERNMNRLTEEMNKAVQLYREGVMSKEEMERAYNGYLLRMTEEREQSRKMEIGKNVSLLGEFGVKAGVITSGMERDFQRLNEAYRQGKIGIGEMRDAAEGFQRAKFKEGVKPTDQIYEDFKMGIGSATDLNNALALDEADKMYADELEDFKHQGSIVNLAAAAAHYQDVAGKMRRDRGYGGYEGSPGGGSRPPMGSINIVTLDQFSEMMLRRWQQRGFLPQ